MHLDNKGYVKEVAEKKPISNNATVGIYWWRKGSDYVKYAERMIKNIEQIMNFMYALYLMRLLRMAKRFQLKR